MRRTLLGGCFLIWSLVTGSVHAEADQPPPAHIATTEPRTPAEELKGFHLPPGFEIQLVAAEPDIYKPINLAFDDRGRLWVTETVEYPFPTDTPMHMLACLTQWVGGRFLCPSLTGHWTAFIGVSPRDRVQILEDFGPDGRARKITTFAEGLNIPISVLPVKDGALIYSIPNIYHFTDPTGSGHGDRREVLYSRYGFKDTHGMTGSFTIGFDGWLYACHGFSNTSTVKAADGSTVTMQSGNTYRMKLDGSHVEQYTHGQVNPFGLAWDPLGNLYSCDCETHPIYQLLRGGWYPSFGKPHDGLGFAPEMMTHSHGSTAIAGICYYAADHFPPAYRDTMFVGNVVTNRINHDRLERHGSTYRAILQPDFLKSDDPWFRPVDIKLGPDGALYVADFYNRIIGHYEVPLNHPGRDRERGRIWRIVYRGLDGQNKLAAPRSDWTKATVAELIQDLAHPNLTVRFKATQQLVERDDRSIDAAVLAVMKPGSVPWQRMHGLWVLERRHQLDDATLTAALKDEDAGVRVHAQRVLSERATLAPALRDLAVAGLKDRDAFVQRATADALGRHPAVANVQPLLDLRQAVPADDTHLLHTVRMALRDQLRPAATWSQLPTASFKEADFRAVADVALGLPTPESAQFLLEQLARLPLDRASLTRSVQHIARYGAAKVQPKLLAFARGDHPTDLDQQAALLRALSQGTQERGGKLSEDTLKWAAELTRQLLASKQGGQVLAGIDLASSLKVTNAREPLTALVVNHEAPEAQRAAALQALLAVDPDGSTAALGRVLNDAFEPVGLREKAALALAGTNQPAAQAELLKALPAATARLQSVIAVGLASSPAGAEKLLEAVAGGKASARLLQEPPVQLRLMQTRLPGLQERLAKLTHGLPSANQQIQEILNKRRDGFTKAKTDLTLGARIFEKHCAVCHQLAGKGTKVGPALDGIGIRGVERLVEDILDPNRNVDQAFRVTMIQLKSGQQVSGLLLREEGEVLVLADSQGKEVRVVKKTVDERSESQLSPMPGNFDAQIPEDEFYQLLAFLLQQRAPK